MASGILCCLESTNTKIGFGIKVEDNIIIDPSAAIQHKRIRSIYDTVATIHRAAKS